MDRATTVGLPGHERTLLGRFLMFVLFACMMGIATCGNCLGIDYWDFDKAAVEQKQQTQSRHDRWECTDACHEAYPDRLTSERDQFNACRNACSNPVQSYSGSNSGSKSMLEPPSSHSKQRAKCAEALTPWGYMNCLKEHGLRE